MHPFGSCNDIDHNIPPQYYLVANVSLWSCARQNLHSPKVVSLASVPPLAALLPSKSYMQPCKKQGRGRHTTYLIRLVMRIVSPTAIR